MALELRAISARLNDEKVWKYVIHNNEPEMTAEVAFEMVKLFEQNQIEMTQDGGWWVDARLGEQTRPHADLDIVIAYNDVTRLRGQIESKGFVDVPRQDTRD